GLGGAGPGPAARLQELLGGSPAGIGVTVIHLGAGAGDEPAEVDLRARVGRDCSLEMQWVSVGAGAASPARADQAGPRLCETLARTLAPLRLSADSSTRRRADTVPLPELPGAADPGSIRTERT